jgi:hypothetical protein
LNEKVAAPVLKTEINGRGDPQKLALASLTGGGRSVGIVRLRTTSHGDFFMLIEFAIEIDQKHVFYYILFFKIKLQA